MRALIGASFIALASRSFGSWDLRNDFSLSSNPNGAWSYGYTTTIGAFTAYTSNTTVSSFYQSQVGAAGLAGWSRPLSPPFPFVAKNFTNQTYFQTWNPTDVLLHPRDSNLFSIARWTSPITAQI